MWKHILSKLDNPEFPLLGPNIYILKIWGLILPERLFKKWIYIFLHASMIVFTATEFVEMWFLRFDMNLFLNNLKITLLATVTAFKIVSFVIWQNRWRSIINYVNKADKLHRETLDFNKKSIINRYTKYSRRITYSYCILMYATVVIVIGQPIFKYVFSDTYRENLRNGSESYTQIVSSWVPFDRNSLPGYITVSLYQCVIAVFGGGWITSFDSNAIVIMVFFRGELQVLKYDCSNIFGNEYIFVGKKESRKRLKSCHKRHAELVKYSRMFDSCLSPIMLLYFIVCSVMLCATVYQITFETSALQKFVTTEYLIFGVSQLIMYCWHSNEVLYVSRELSLGPYESIWWTRDVAEQRNINILTEQFKKNIVLSAGPFNKINITTFLNILKGAYSYYTLLSKSYKS